MTGNRRWPDNYLRMARYDLEDGAADLAKGRFARVFIRAASSVEYSLKAALFAMGLDVPEEHRLGGYIRRRRSSFPKEYRETVIAWAVANEELADRVVEAKCGSNRRDRLPDEIFSRREQATEALATASDVHTQVAKLVREVR